MTYFWLTRGKQKNPLHVTPQMTSHWGQKSLACHWLIIVRKAYTLFLSLVLSLFFFYGCLASYFRLQRKGLFLTQTIKYFRPEGFYWASDSIQICATRVFFLSLFSCNFDDQLSQRFVFFMVGIHQLTITKGVQQLISPNSSYLSINLRTKVKFSC